MVIASLLSPLDLREPQDALMEGELSLILEISILLSAPGCLSLVEGRPRDHKSWSEAGEPMPHAGRVGSNPTPGAHICSDPY